MYQRLFKTCTHQSKKLGSAKERRKRCNVQILSRLRQGARGILRAHIGKSALQLVPRQDSKWAKQRRIHIAISLKKRLRTNLKRSYVASETRFRSLTSLSPSPTTCRGSVSMLLTFASFPWRRLSCVDITHAFLQSDDWSGRDEMFVAPLYFYRPS